MNDEVESIQDMIISGSKYRMKQSTYEGIRRYVDDRIKPGSFITAVLSNNLRDSFGKGDQENRDTLFEIVRYLYWEVPGDCWGSHERVSEWLGEVEVTVSCKDSTDCPCTCHRLET